MPTRPSSRGTNGSLRLVRVLCSCRPTVGSAPGPGSGNERLSYPRLLANRLLSGQADRGGGDPLAPAAEAEAVGGLGGDPDPLGRQAEGGGPVGPHGRGRGAEAGPGRDTG